MATQLNVVYLDKIQFSFPIANVLRLLATKISLYNQHRTAVIAMNKLDDRLLQDIGITRYEISAAVSGAKRQG